MSQNIFQNWDGMLQAFQKPMQELIDLNIQTINEFSKQPGLLDNFQNMKSPEQIINIQMKLLSDATQSSLQYAQRYAEISERNILEFSKKFSDFNKESMKHTDFKNKK